MIFCCHVSFRGGLPFCNFENPPANAWIEVPAVGHIHMIAAHCCLNRPKVLDPNFAMRTRCPPLEDLDICQEPLYSLTTAVPKILQRGLTAPETFLKWYLISYPLRWTYHPFLLGCGCQGCERPRTKPLVSCWFIAYGNGPLNMMVHGIMSTFTSHKSGVISGITGGKNSMVSSWVYIFWGRLIHRRVCRDPGNEELHGNI